MAHYGHRCPYCGTDLVLYIHRKTGDHWLVCDDPLCGFDAPSDALTERYPLIDSPPSARDPV
jgi:ssDNA-binding Zn-finger/Zn-ribbon topoisomerase 1